ncbi:nitroreductase/quinone reductase family protein [Gordonia shandongensis]|uniref:nitroreductase/quinone reductase family protein n=1 Tax=Gordonia shandongensis TaxID=376351 RepID=UPI0004042D71|nr:nitroreductase/quinone reductase family protein [Gordonia shandongensis]
MPNAADVHRGGRLLALSNTLVGGAARLGMAPRYCHELPVAGRVSGRVTARPVNVLDMDGRSYLVAPRGETQWVHNVRVRPDAELRRARTTERVRLVECDDAVKAPLLREYLRRWRGQVAAFVGDLSADSGDAELRAAAPRFPVFEVVPVLESDAR